MTGCAHRHGLKEIRILTHRQDQTKLAAVKQESAKLKGISELINHDTNADAGNVNKTAAGSRSSRIRCCSACFSHRGVCFASYANVNMCRMRKPLLTQPKVTPSFFRTLVTFKIRQRGRVGERSRSKRSECARGRNRLQFCNAHASQALAIKYAPGRIAGTRTLGTRVH